MPSALAKPSRKDERTRRIGLDDRRELAVATAQKPDLERAKLATRVALASDGVMRDGALCGLLVRCLEDRDPGVDGAAGWAGEH